MQAMIIQQFGNTDVFEQAEVTTPAPGANEVLIAVAASSVNPVDYKIRSGEYAEIAPAFPAILHSDVAGTIAAVGRNVTAFKEGDEVYGCAGGFGPLNGALAEYMLTDPALLALKPTSLTMAQAAALPLVAITAWEALVNKADVYPGQHVLVHAGAGGVGHIAIQLAKALGAQVSTTCSTEQKAEVARKAGAEHVIFYRDLSVTDYVQQYTDGHGFDVVFDTVGGATLDASLNAAANYGQVITIQARASHDLTPLFLKNLTLHGVLMPTPLLSGVGREHYGQLLQEVAQLADQQQIKPFLDPQSFNFSEVAAAHDYLAAGKAMGKVVLQQNLGKK